MKDNSFERVMNQIVNQAEAEQQREIRDFQRRLTLNRVRRVALLMSVVSGLAAAYIYRSPISNYVSAKLPAVTQSQNNSSTGAASATIAKAADNANTRDQIVEEVSK